MFLTPVFLRSDKIKRVAPLYFSSKGRTGGKCILFLNQMVDIPPSLDARASRACRCSETSNNSIQQATRTGSMLLSLPHSSLRRPHVYGDSRKTARDTRPNYCHHVTSRERGRNWQEPPSPARLSRQTVNKQQKIRCYCNAIIVTYS